MEIYQIVLIVFGAIFAFLLLFFIAGSFGFFCGIFKRKPYNELGDKRHETEQRKFVKEERRKAIEHLRTVDCEKYEITAFDGITLRGKMFRAKEKSDRLIICVHGFTSHSFREFGAVTPYLNSLGLDVLLVDDRAHGASDGKYTGFSVLDRIDVKGWVEKFRPEYKDLYLYGISMGAATSAMVAGDIPDKIDGVIFDCGFTCPEDAFLVPLVKIKHFGKILLAFGDVWCRIILKFSFKKVSALETIKNAKCPFVFIQGDKDPTVTVDMSNRMYASCGSAVKSQEIFAGAEHVGCYYVDKPRYEKILADFFEKSRA